MSPVLSLRGVAKTIDSTPILHDINWQVNAGERWIILGANGSGKTTLIRIASLWMHPSSGEVELLGEALGKVDVRKLRRKVGLTSAAMANQLRGSLSATEVVMTARFGALEPWWHQYSSADRDHAIATLERVGCAHRADHDFGTLSSGERQRVLLARALSIDPGIILLDEPNAGLDLRGREELLGVLSDLAADPATPPIVLVTHHAEEIPAHFTHCLLLRNGTIGTQAPIKEALTSDLLSECFDMPLELTLHNNRYSATAL